MLVLLDTNIDMIASHLSSLIMAPVLNIARAFSDLLIDAVIVGDGPIRNPSKRESCQRKVNAENSAI